MNERRACEVTVRGDYACFSRPDFKTERVTYPAMTPSSARGLLESIFWKPEFRWEVSEIAVLKPIQTMSVLRNELDSRQGSRTTPFLIENHRQQRTSLILRDVAYVIRADVVMRSTTKDPAVKYIHQFEDRVSRGQFHHAPSLGTREFAATFEPTSGLEEPIQKDLDIGPMLFDMAFIPDRERQELSWRGGSGEGRGTVSGYAQAIFFDAKLEKGCLKIPSKLYAEKARLEGGD